MSFTNNITINVYVSATFVSATEAMYIVQFRQIYQIYILVIVNHYLIISDTTYLRIKQYSMTVLSNV